MIERLSLTERDDFPLDQSQDESLRNAFEQVRSIDGRPLQTARPPSYPYFAILKDRLYRVTQDAQSKQDTTQLLVPKSRREMLFQAAHCNPMAGHLGQATTLNRLMARFFWPGIHENVRRWCAACRECQLVNPPASPKAPLRPLPLMQVPFERIGMDLIGPLERSARGHRSSSGGLCNPIPGGSSAPQHFCKKCGGGSVQYDLPGGNPERDSHRPGHGVHVTDHP